MSPPTHPSSHCSILSHPSHPSHLISSHPIPCFTLSHPISCVLSLPILSHSISSHSFPSVLFCPIPFPLLYPVSTCPAPVVLSHAIQFPHLLAISSCSACPVLSCPTLSSPQQQLCPCLCLRVTNLAQASCPDQSPMAICFSSIPAVFPLGARPMVPAMPQAGGGAGPGDSPSAVTAHTCFHTRTRSCGEDKEHGAQGRSPPGHPSRMNLPPRPFFYSSCPMHLPPPCT